MSAKIKNADMVEAKDFQAMIKSNYAHLYKKFDGPIRYRMNYHQRVFGAKDTTAHLVLSDWENEEDPGGEADEELIWNFIQVQPYFDKGSG